MTIKTDSVQGLPNPGLDAAREGRDFRAFINGRSSLNVVGGVVITNAGTTINMESGYRYVIACVYFGLTTSSDSVRFELVTTSLPNGGGAATGQTVRFIGATTATGDGLTNGPIYFTGHPPVFTQAHGQSIAMRVETNDQGATVNCGFTGWKEVDR
jgi:hypothetical protein